MNDQERWEQEAVALGRWGTRLEREAGEAAAGRAPALVESARSQGLLDVAYGFADSPFGTLLVAVTPHGLARVAYPDRDVDRELERLAREVSPRVLESAAATEEARKQLDEYFGRRRRHFDVPIDFALAGRFTRRVLEETARIPFGAVLTYREVAVRAGSPRASRAVGNALGANPVPIVVPCHRVVRTGGTLGGYTGGLDRKVALLRLEGVDLPGTLEPSAAGGNSA